MSFEYSKLLGRIKEKCGTQAEFAKAINISERSVSQKLNGKRSWRQDEIVRACEALDIKEESIPSYFFTMNVQNIEHGKSA